MALFVVLLLKAYLAMKVEYTLWSFYDVLFPALVGPLSVLILSKTASDFKFIFGVVFLVSVSMLISYLVYVVWGIPNVEFNSSAVFSKYSIGFWAYFYPISLVVATISTSLYFDRYR